MRKLCISLLAILMICGCSSSKESADSFYANNEPNARNEYAMSGDYAAEMSFDGSGADEEETKGVESEKITTRKLIYTYDYYLQTESYEQIIAAIKEATAKSGGYIQSGSEYGNEYYSSSNNRHYSFVLRIPADYADEFSKTINELEGAVITSSSENVEDVTSSYMDTEAHINNLKVEEDTLNALMKKAEDISDIITLEERISQVRYEIERYENSLKNMDTLINYATYNISVDEVHRYVYKEQTLGERIANEFYYSIEGVKHFGEGLVIFLIGDSIWILIWGLVIFGIYKIIRKLIQKNSLKKGKKESLQKEEKTVDNIE